MNYRRFSILVIVLLTCSAWCEDDLKAVEKSLRKMKGKYLVLRNAYSESNLSFGARGNLQGKGTPAPVSLNGVFQVDSVKLGPRWIEMKGARAALYLDRRSQKVQGVKTGERIRIRVESDQDIGSLTQAETLLGMIFYDGSYLASLQSRYWKQLAPEGKESEVAKKGGQPIGMLWGERPVYAVEPGIVDPPSPTYTPDPEYSEQARQDRVSGSSKWRMYLNERGQPEIIEISTALEKTLDLKTVDALRNWRFKPAMKNGVPVAVRVDVEVNFSIY